MGDAWFVKLSLIDRPWKCVWRVCLVVYRSLQFLRDLSLALFSGSFQVPSPFSLSSCLSDAVRTLAYPPWFPPPSLACSLPTYTTGSCGLKCSVQVTRTRPFFSPPCLLLSRLFPPSYARGGASSFVFCSGERLPSLVGCFEER